MITPHAVGIQFIESRHFNITGIIVLLQLNVSTKLTSHYRIVGVKSFKQSIQCLINER